MVIKPDIIGFMMITNLVVSYRFSKRKKITAKLARYAADIKVRPFGFASKKSSFWS